MIKIIRENKLFLSRQTISFFPQKEIASCHAMFISRKTTWLSLKKHLCECIYFVSWHRNPDNLTFLITVLIATRSIEYVIWKCAKKSIKLKQANIYVKYCTNGTLCNPLTHPYQLLKAHNVPFCILSLFSSSEFEITVCMGYKGFEIHDNILVKLRFLQILWRCLRIF